MSKWITAVAAVVVVVGGAWAAKGPAWCVDKIEGGVATLESVDGKSTKDTTAAARWREGQLLNADYTINHKATDARFVELHRRFKALK